MARKPYRSSGRGVLVSGRGHLSWLRVIREILGSDNLSCLSRSCFGHFMRVPSIQFQGQLYNVLIRKLERSSLGRLRLSFRINGREVEFGPTEFAIMTGLSFNGNNEPPAESDFHKVIFKGREPLLFCDIHKAFIKECKATNDNSKDSLRLALLYILYGILLIRARKSKKIDLRYLHVADDLVKFDRFAWGQVAYEFFVRSTHRSKEILDNLMLQKKKLALDANGFTISLQTWAYEIMPNLSSECATFVPNVEPCMPRMLRWSASKPYRFDFINSFFLPSNAGECPVTIEPSHKEKWMLKLLGLGMHDSVAALLGGSYDGGMKSIIRRLRSVVPDLESNYPSAEAMIPLQYDPCELSLSRPSIK